jgi:peptidyl-prolyl cis-trans isomerase SurA
MRSFPKLRALLILAVVFGLAVSVLGQREFVDGIVAVVGDEVILASEVASQLQVYIFQSGQQPQTEAEVDELRRELLDQMVSDRLFLLAAKKDTTIVVRDEEIEAELDRRLASVSESFPSEQAFMDALTAEGITLRDLRKRFRGEVENQLLKQRFIQRRLYSVSISRHEVEQFYDKFGDSIPTQPEAVKLAHILLPIEPSPAVEDSVKALAEQLRQQVVDGADFATISAQNSSLGAGANGGDLGYISREDVVPEFARSAFNLRVGDISGPVRTQFGYHIIKCEGYRGEQGRFRHILLSVQPSSADSQRVITLADSLLTALDNGASFEELAKEYSADSETRAKGGELGWFAVQDLPKEFQPVVAGWTTPEEVRGPVATSEGLHLLKLLEHRPAHEFSLEDDYDQIKELARQDKTGRLVDDWIDDLKDSTYIVYMENR